MSTNNIHQSPSHSRDCWSKIDIIVRIFASICIPFLILYFGYKITMQQTIDNEKKRDLDRVAFLLKHLASDNIDEKVLAINFCDYLVKSNQFPYEFATYICETARYHKDISVQFAAINLIEALKSNDNYRKNVQKYFDELVPDYRKLIMVDIPEQSIDKLIENFKKKGAEVDISKQSNGQLKVIVNLKTAPSDLIRNFWKPDGINVNKENEERLRNWLAQKGINESLPFFIYAGQYKDARIRLIKDFNFVYGVLNATLAPLKIEGKGTVGPAPDLRGK